VSDLFRIAVASDIHYASAAEQARPEYWLIPVTSRWRRRLLAAYKRHIWLRDPFAHNHLLDAFIAQARGADTGRGQRRLLLRLGLYWRERRRGFCQRTGMP